MARFGVGRTVGYRGFGRSSTAACSLARDSCRAAGAVRRDALRLADSGWPPGASVVAAPTTKQRALFRGAPCSLGAGAVWTHAAETEDDPSLPSPDSRSRATGRRRSAGATSCGFPGDGRGCRSGSRSSRRGWWGRFEALCRLCAAGSHRTSAISLGRVWRVGVLRAVSQVPAHDVFSSFEKADEADDVCPLATRSARSGAPAAAPWSVKVWRSSWNVTSSTPARATAARALAQVGCAEDLAGGRVCRRGHGPRGGKSAGSGARARRRADALSGSTGRGDSSSNAPPV